MSSGWFLSITAGVVSVYIWAFIYTRAQVQPQAIGPKSRSERRAGGAFRERHSAAEPNEAAALHAEERQLGRKRRHDFPPFESISEAFARELKRQTGVEEEPGVISDAMERAYKRVTTPPNLAIGLALDRTPETKTVWLEVTNSGDTDAVGLVARLIDAKPSLFESRRESIGLPLVLTTKARFDRHRTKLELLPQRPFDVASGDKCLIPVFRAIRFNPDVATIISEAGEIQVLFQDVELTVEVTGGGIKSFRSIISIRRGPTGSWMDSAIVETVGTAEGRGSVRSSEAPPQHSLLTAMDNDCTAQEAKHTTRSSSKRTPGNHALRAAGKDRDVSISEALGYAMLGQWGKSYPDALLDGHASAGETLEQFVEAARHGRVRVWGKSSPAGLYTLIPSEHWEGRELTAADLISAAGLPGGADPFRHLMVNRSEIENEWPHDG